MYTTRYALIMSLLVLASCSKWNVEDKRIKEQIVIPPTPTPTPTPTTGNVTLVNTKPTVLGSNAATVVFKVETPTAVAEFGVVLTGDPNQIAGLMAGTGAPDRRAVTGAVVGDGTIIFEIKNLLENSPYYVVAFAKDASGKTTFSQNYAGFRTKFPPKTPNWQQLANLPTQRAYSFNPLFTIGGKVYVGGTNQEKSPEGFYYFKQLYEYDPATNFWTQKKDFPGTARSETTVAVLNDKAYVMFGVAQGRLSYTSDAWEYDPANDTWRPLANPPQNAPGRSGDYNLQAGGIPFVYNNRVYSFFGRGTYNKDVNLINIYNSLYALDPKSNTWEVSFPLDDQKLSNDVIYAAARSGAFSFQYGEWVYFGGGLAASYYNATGSNLPYAKYFNSRQIWAYNVASKALRAVATLPSSFNDCSNSNDTGGRMAGFAFSVGAKAYITDCSSQIFVADLSSPGNLTVQLSTALRHPTPTTGIGIGVGDRAYFGLRNADWWAFTPN